MSIEAQIAITAAKHFYQWGNYAATRYALKRGVHPALIRLARQLESVRGF
jgi:hypothetical protein